MIMIEMVIILGIRNMAEIQRELDTIKFNKNKDDKIKK
jgi:hypothetical protein